MIKRGKLKLSFIDLFAGCGGLSLGLENAGFHPVYVNELNKDAMESYLINRDDKYPMLREKYSCYDIKSLTRGNKALDELKSGLKCDYGIEKGELDLVVGGPPCQGYSGIGHRRSYSVSKSDIPSNYLYKDMLKVIKKMNPKAFIFENVRGLLSSRWTKDGTKGEIWEDVLKTFHSLHNFFVDFALLQAKDYGVPQNRPRVILVGLRSDIDFKQDNNLPASGLLPKPQENNYPHPVDLLRDLVDDAYLNNLKTSKYVSNPSCEIQKKLRTNKNRRGYMRKGELLGEQDYSNHSDLIRRKFQYMIKNNGKIPKSMQTKKFSQRVIPKYWGKDGPNITVASLPEDYVHFQQPRSFTVREWARLQMFPDWYRFAGKRTTGGLRRAGNPRLGIWEREVPKYTQIGNAIPVELAERIGKHLKRIIV
jgi:DNA (cytosine-5)-methyltransferase 1|tara:strand:- start:5 stop:1267 length:1263 start_codon:yes stop_codon:yes gene_type:complete